MGRPISLIEFEEGLAEICTSTLLSIEKMRECTLKFQRLPNSCVDTTEVDALDTRFKAVMEKKRQMVIDQAAPPPQAEDEPVRLHFLYNCF